MNDRPLPCPDHLLTGTCERSTDPCRSPCATPDATPASGRRAGGFSPPRRLAPRQSSPGTSSAAPGSPRRAGVPPGRRRRGGVGFGQLEACEKAGFEVAVLAMSMMSMRRRPTTAGPRPQVPGLPGNAGCRGRPDRRRVRRHPRPQPRRDRPRRAAEEKARLLREAAHADGPRGQGPRRGRPEGGRRHPDDGSLERNEGASAFASGSPPGP